MPTRSLVLMLLLLWALATWAIGPALEPVPTAAAPTGLPAPAAWPVLRLEKPARMLAITWKGASAASYLRIARRLQTRMELRYIGGGDDIYHVNDKWIEPQGNPTAAELKAASIAAAIAAVRRDYDVIFCDNPDKILANPDMQAALLAYLEQGGTVVACGYHYPDAASPLGKVWPAKPGPNNWLATGAKRTDNPALAGVPLEYLAAWNWAPTPQVADGAKALATGQCGAAFSRQVGTGTLVFVPAGPISRHWRGAADYGSRFDHDEIWLRLWEGLLCESPVSADLPTGAKTAPPGQPYALAGKIFSVKAWKDPVAVSVHVCTPDGRVVYKSEGTTAIAAGWQDYPVAVPVDPAWPAGLYPVYLTLGAEKAQYHQAMQLIPVAGSVNLALTSEKKGYRLGEIANFTLAATGTGAWTGTARYAVYDYRGRVLAAGEKPLTLVDGKGSLALTYKLADHGVKVDAYRLQVAAVAKDAEVARAEVKFYKYEPWNMRNEYQWSTWAGIACAPLSVVPAGMRLMAHAGMNALGYPGRSELWYAAERWGWRYYNEGVGMNTFSPVIEYENDAEIEAALSKEAVRATDSMDLNSAAFVLGSVGEEAGFKHGWGTRYYWDTPVAPEKACKALQWYLKTVYPNLEAVNAAWGTKYAAWDEVKLTKEFSERAPSLDADGWAHPKNSPLGAGAAGVSLAPYQDTAAFYNWYYDRIIAVALRILHTKINPVTQAMSSAPTIGSADYDVRLTGPSCWNESQSFTTADGPAPGFGLVWGHFDWPVMQDNVLWGFLLQRSGHNNYWVDIPLMFNNDLSHTRSTFAMRRWTTKLAGHERIILDAQPRVADVGLLGPTGITADAQTPRNMTTSLQVALNQAGYGFANVDAASLGKCKTVFAVGRQAVSKTEADAITAYVNGGGTFVFTPRFASQTELSMPQSESPGCGLATTWGMKVTKRTEITAMYHDHSMQNFALDGLGEAYKGAKAAGQTIFRETVAQTGWTVLAEYPDHTPAVLTRALGKGRLIYLNQVYQSHWYIQWVTPTDANRQGFYNLVRWCCAQGKSTSHFTLDGKADEALHIATKEFTDPTGKIHYVIARTNGEVPWVNASLRWTGPGTTGYEVFTTAEGPTTRVGTAVSLNLRPGAGKLLAFLQAPVAALRVKAPAALTAGQPLALAVSVVDAKGLPVPGAFPCTVRVSTAAGEIRGLERSVSLKSGDSCTINTALTDPAGTWTVTVTDGITGTSGTATVKVTAPAVRAPRYAGWNLRSEVEEPLAMTAAEFLDRLHKLADLYRAAQDGTKWMAKQNLGYYYDYFPGTRHEQLRPLNDADWAPFAKALHDDIAAGAHLILTGEDVGIDPGTGLSTWPHHDGGQLAALAAALKDAKWTVATPDGATLRASLDKGDILLCRESIDAAGHSNPDAARWQARWLEEVAKGHGAPVDVKKLNLNWFWTAGFVPTPTPAAATVTWLADNRRELKLTVDPDKRTGAVIVLAVPPTGHVTGITWDASAPVRYDIGCDGTVDPLQPGLIELYLQHAVVTRTLYRDANGNRLVPIRLEADKKTEVTISGVKVVCTL